MGGSRNSLGQWEQQAAAHLPSPLFLQRKQGYREVNSLAEATELKSPPFQGSLQWIFYHSPC